MGHLLVLVGPSGSGKTTIARRVLELSPRVGFAGSNTTRKKRVSDIPGEYRYLTEAQFVERIDESEFLWHIQHGGARYGTERKAIDRVLRLPDCIGILMLVPSVLLKLQAHLNQWETRQGVRPSWTCCYIEAGGPTKLRERMLARRDSPEVIEHRISNEAQWFSQTKSFVPHVQMIDNSGPFEVALSQITRLLPLQEAA